MSFHQRERSWPVPILDVIQLKEPLYSIFSFTGLDYLTQSREQSMSSPSLVLWNGTRTTGKQHSCIVIKIHIYADYLTLYLWICVLRLWLVLINVVIVLCPVQKCYVSVEMVPLSELLCRNDSVWVWSALHLGEIFSLISWWYMFATGQDNCWLCRPFQFKILFWTEEFR